MPARPGESRQLVAALLGDDVVVAEAAAARLVILGRPSVRPLLSALDQAAVPQAVVVLGVLERLADATAFPALAKMLDTAPEPVAEAAVGAIAALLDVPRGQTGATALDRLTSVALDRTRPVGVRVAAVRALAALDLETVAVLRAQLLDDPEAQVRDAAAAATPVRDDGSVTGHMADARTGSADADDGPQAVIRRAVASGHLPDDAEQLRLALTHADGVSLSDLHRLIELLRAAEMRTADAVATGWLACRAAAHQALATRQSRLAVYDLRDTLHSHGPRMPVGMLSALKAVGDTASLDALCEAWTAHEDAWFRSQLAAIATAIVGREGLTRRHAVVRRLAQRWPEALGALWPTAPTR